jgi:hypothetical protein
MPASFAKRARVKSGAATGIEPGLIGEGALLTVSFETVAEWRNPLVLDPAGEGCLAPTLTVKGSTPLRP